MSKRVTFLPFLCVLASFGAEIVLPSSALERDKPVQAAYRTNRQATGKGTLSLQWTDVHGRVVEDRKIPVVLNDEMEIGFTLDLRRAAAIDNELRAHFSFERVDKKGRPDKREEDTKVQFIAKPDRKWWDYVILMWERYPTEHVAGRPVVGVETHRFRNGGATIVGLLSNPQLRVDELGPPEFKSNERFEKPQTIRLALAEELYAYDVRGGKSLGRKKEITVTLDPYEPAVFAFSPVAVPGLEAAAPVRVQRGTTARIGVRMDGETPAAVHVLHAGGDESGRKGGRTLLRQRARGWRSRRQADSIRP